MEAAISSEIALPLKVFLFFARFSDCLISVLNQYPLQLGCLEEILKETQKYNTSPVEFSIGGLKRSNFGFDLECGSCMSGGTNPATLPYF